MTLSPEMAELWSELERYLADEQLLVAGFDRDQRLRRMREAAEQQALLTPLPPDLVIEQVDASGVPCELLSFPGAATSHMLLHMHGGGYIAYSARTARELATRIARATGCRVLVPDYRLAPEHPFPAAVDDGVSAYLWLREQRPGPIGLVGDSAGGGLALAVTLALRDRGQHAPGALALISPWTDLTLPAPQREPAQIRDIISTGILIDAVEQYAGDADPAQPLLSPVYADLTGLPAMHIEASGSELLLEDSLRLAVRARQAGVPVTVQVTEDVPHVFPALMSTPEAHAATDRIGRFLNDQLAGAGVAADQAWNTTR